MIFYMAHTSGWNWFIQALLAVPFVIGLFFYLWFVYLEKSKGRSWPYYRVASWIVGTIIAAGSVSGPLAHLAHQSFQAHMVGHLLFGMLAPLLMVLAAPMTLLLRALCVKHARLVTRVLRSGCSRVITHPVVASILNIGGLWLLYTTDLYSLMHQHLWLYLLVHTHVFLAGYLFTISMIYTDPVPHRVSYLYRSVVLVFALAGHGILSKYIYTHPPHGVHTEQAEQGAILMYYGGDAVDVIIIFILCLHWFRAARPKSIQPAGVYNLPQK